MADEVRRVAAKGCHAVTFSENPEKLGWPSFHSDHWDPFWQACVGRGHRRLPAHRVVVAADHHVGRRADQRDDHAAADQHRAGRGRPAVVAGASASSPTCSSPCPRAASAGSRTSSSGSTTCTSTTATGPARTSATSSRARCSTSTSIFCFIDDARRASRTATTSASTTSRWECDYPHSDSTWPDSPELLEQVARRRPRRRGQQDDPRERDAALPATTRSPTGPASSAPSAPCGPRPPTSTPRCGARARRPATRARVPSPSSTSSTPPAPTAPPPPSDPPSRTPGSGPQQQRRGGHALAAR